MYTRKGEELRELKEATVVIRYYVIVIDGIARPYPRYANYGNATDFATACKICDASRAHGDNAVIVNSYGIQMDY